MKPLSLSVWHIEQITWDPDWTKGQPTTLLVEAHTCAEAVQLSGDGDAIHEIRRVTNLGPIVVRSPASTALASEASPPSATTSRLLAAAREFLAADDAARITHSCADEVGHRGEAVRSLRDAVNHVSK